MVNIQFSASTINPLIKKFGSKGYAIVSHFRPHREAPGVYIPQLINVNVNTKYHISALRLWARAHWCDPWEQVEKSC